MTKKEIFAYVKKNFNTTPDYPWTKSPQHAVLRHSKNGKWYGLVMEISKNKLGLNGNEKVEIINLKCDPELNGILRGNEGILPAYHMNKEHWITIVLNSSFPDEQIFNLIDSSYNLTK